MAEEGLISLAVDLAFWGDSEGLSRNAVSPDMYKELYIVSGAGHVVLYGCVGLIPFIKLAEFFKASC